ncbi:hypothetical protein, partial [uncultured Duncaniella sp.]|uniref:hypothetical protein n=1 Tax=uncultured Duncaniella sp. TaxID=2768039 RepID=UPI0025B6E878
IHSRPYLPKEPHWQIPHKKHSRLPAKGRTGIFYDAKFTDSLSEIYGIYKKIVRCPFQSRSNRTKAKKASNSYKTIPFQ